MKRVTKTVSLFLTLCCLAALACPSYASDAVVDKAEKEYCILTQPTAENPTVVTNADEDCGATITYTWYEVTEGQTVYEMTDKNSQTTIGGYIRYAEFIEDRWVYKPESFRTGRAFSTIFYVPTRVGDVIRVVTGGPTPIKYFSSNGGKEALAPDGSMLAAVQYSEYYLNYLLSLGYGTQFPTAEDYVQVQIIRNEECIELSGENGKTLSHIEFEKEYFADVIIEDETGTYLLRSDRFMRERKYEIVSQPTAENPTVVTNADEDIKSVQWMTYAKAGEKNVRTLEVTDEDGFMTVKGSCAYMHYDGDVWRYNEALSTTGSSVYNVFDIAVERGDVLRIFPQGNTPIYKIAIPYSSPEGLLQCAAGDGNARELMAEKLSDGSYEIRFENKSEEDEVSDLEIYVFYGVNENAPMVPTASDTIRATVTRKFSATNGVELITPESDILRYQGYHPRFKDAYEPDGTYLSDGWWEDEPNGIHLSNPVSIYVESGDMVAVELENPEGLMRHVYLKDPRRSELGDRFIYFRDTRVYIGRPKGYAASETLCTTAKRARVTVFNKPRSYPVLLEGENAKTLSKVEAGSAYYCVVEYKNGKKLTSDTFGDVQPRENSDILMKKVPRWVAVFALRYKQSQVDWEGGDYFDDVSEDDDVYTSVCWAYENGIITGTGNRRFSPGTYLTREQLAVILYRNEVRLDHYLSDGVDLCGYTDVDKISPWAYDAVSWAVAENKITPYSKTELRPQEEVTREEVVKAMFEV